MKRPAPHSLSRLLREGLPPAWQRVNRNQLAALEEFFYASRKQLPAELDELRRQLLDTLLDWIAGQQRQISQLHANQREFTTRLSRAASTSEVQEHVLDYARILGASRQQLVEDRRAFARWFGPDVVSERYQLQYADCERHLSFSLERLGTLAAAQLAGAASLQDARQRWRQLDLQQALGDLLAYDGDLRVRLAAFHALARAIRALPTEAHADCLSDNIIAYLFRLGLDRTQPIWLQTEALALLSSLEYPQVPQIIESRLAEPAEGDDFFVRQHAVSLLAFQPAGARSDALLQLAAEDASPTVRQALVDVLVRLRAAPLHSLLPQLALKDPAPEVRGHAVHALIALAEHAPALGLIRHVLEHGCAQEQAPRTLRLHCHVLAAIAGVLAGQQREQELADWGEFGFALLSRLHSEAADLRVRRWAAQARENLWCIVDPQARSLYRELQEQVVDKPVRRKLKIRLPDGIDDDRVGRVLSCLTQQDFGIDASRRGNRLILQRWESFGFRLWRAWYELIHPSPDKRQAGDHTIGRLFYGLLQVPSARMAELSPTKVPGEPLYMADEDGWRPYLPLVDQLISSLDQGWPTRPMQIFSSEGISEITPPAGLFARLRARSILTLRFAHYARLRNWDASGTGSPGSYLGAIGKLGFRSRLRSWTDLRGAPLPPDPKVTRFFPNALVLPPFMLEWWQRYSDYFVSVYQNTLQQLVIFLGGMLTLFLGRHVAANFSIRRARNQIPLVIGGWGTRGKSGTERLKAALFNGLGFHVISKTTGCEAMFLHGYSHRELHEMFLFRPYDKATIWEQGNLIRLSRDLGADVFLWECMGLTPSYVNILQKQWMRDDLSTITNTYPDHEDLQGPAGINIPIVMTEFIPRHSTLITSEAEMLPVLQEACQRFDTRCIPVGWIDAELLPSDVLKRFPYEEHPTNIALVLRMAAELGIPRLFALKAMADHVVLDLGVLKVYPVAQARGRRLQFTNGMSANERLGAMGNWTRLGFDRQDPEAEPGIWISTVINNRADRVARSRVFAEVLVNDITADRHFLIGTNLEGFMGYVEQAWASRSEDITLWPAAQQQPDPRAEWQRQARRLRVCTTQDAVYGRLSAMLEGLEVAFDAGQLRHHLASPQGYLQSLGAVALQTHLPAIIAQHQRYHGEWLQYRKLAERLQPGMAASSAVDGEVRELLWQWLRSRIEIIHSPFVSGEEIVSTLCEQTPPGYLNRIIGMQNIKGPGLDWVYRWQAWDKVYASGQQILSGSRSEATRALQLLANFKEYGLLSQEYMQALLARVRELPVGQSEGVLAELQLIEATLESGRQHGEALQLGGKAQARPQNAAWLTVLGWAEQFLDIGDAVRRRRTANRIYRDLASQRISAARAADELQQLIKRQKGGWLTHG